MVFENVENHLVRSSRKQRQYGYERHQRATHKARGFDPAISCPIVEPHPNQQNGRNSRRQQRTSCRRAGAQAGQRAHGRTPAAPPPQLLYETPRPPATGTAGKPARASPQSILRSAGQITPVLRTRPPMASPLAGPIGSPIGSDDREIMKTHTPPSKSPSPSWPSPQPHARLRQLGPNSPIQAAFQ